MTRRRAFTLMELMVVMAIVAVIAALSFPVFKRVSAGRQATACVSNLRQLGVALNLYLAEHGNVMPSIQAARAARSDDVQVIDNTLNPYAQDPRVFCCPADERFATTTGTSYFWNPALSGQAVASLNFLAVEDRSRIPILSDKEGFHSYQSPKVNILFADGHATQDLHFFTGQ